MVRASAIVHTAPATRAAFTQYTVEFEPGGSLGPAGAQRFVFVLEGEVSLQAAGKKHALAKGGYAYLPPGNGSPISAPRTARIAVIEKAFQPVDTASSGTNMPAALIGEEDSIVPRAFMGDEALLVRSLLPDNPAFDFAVNTMTYQPGAILPMVRIARNGARPADARRSGDLPPR